MKKRRFFFIALVLSAVGLMVSAYFTELNHLKKQNVESWSKNASADCAVVLTGAYGRTREGLDLLARKQIQKLIITGVHPKASLRDILPIFPFYGSLNEKNVVLERHSATTYGNAQQSWTLVESLGCRDILLITSHFHMKRAQLTFKAVYPEKFPIYPHSVISGRWIPEFDELLLEISKHWFYSLWAYQ